MHVFQHRHQLGQVEAGTGRIAHAEGASGHLPAERQALQVEEAGGAFEIGERIGIDLQQPLELGAAADLPLQHVEQLLVVPLQDAEKVHDIAVHVVDHFQLGPVAAAEEHAAHAHEWFDVAIVRHRGDTLGDAPGKGALAAEPWCDRTDRLDRFERRQCNQFFLHE